MSQKLERAIMFDTLMPDLNGASILVTGGTGSFGKSFIRSILENYFPKRVIVFSRDELKQFEMSFDPAFVGRKNLRFFIGDVRDADRLETAMQRVDLVVHAAALKQVETAEYNPIECIRTNINGAENVVRAALRCGVRQVLALSTDKAANPVNLYGASKLAADKIFVAANNLSGLSQSRFAVVRYGNVHGSRGSVVPFFQKLISENVDSLPITDPRMTRFWITLPQGINFVLSSIAMMQGGEIFVPKIPSMRIVDLAKAVAPNLPMRTVGIRPGEKLHEALITEDEARNTLETKDRFIVTPPHHYWTDEIPDYAVLKATPVAEDFRYTSDINTQWLSVEDIRKLLESVDK